MTSSLSHFLCPRCGSILTGFDSLPELCPRCGGVEIIAIGKEGEYKVKDLRKEHHFPFRPDIFYKNED